VQGPHARCKPLVWHAARQDLLKRLDSGQEPKLRPPAWARISDAHRAGTIFLTTTASPKPDPGQILLARPSRWSRHPSAITQFDTLSTGKAPTVENHAEVTTRAGGETHSQEFEPMAIGSSVDHSRSSGTSNGSRAKPRCPPKTHREAQASESRSREVLTSPTRLLAYVDIAPPAP